MSFGVGNRFGDECRILSAAGSQRIVATGRFGNEYLRAAEPEIVATIGLEFLLTRRSDRDQVTVAGQ